MNLVTIPIKIKLEERLLGTVPKDKSVYKTYIAHKTTEENKEEETATVEEIEGRGWTGFHSDEKGLFVYDYLVKGFIKNAATVLKDSKAIKIKNLKSKIQNYVFVFPRRVYFGKKKADGVFERPLQAMTMQGPRVSLVRSDYIEEGLVLKFEIKLLEHKEITKATIMELFEYGQLQGLGQFRNGSFGRFVVVK